MRKLWLYLVLLAATLSACSQPSGAKPTDGSSGNPPPKNTPVTVSTQNPNAKEMACSVVSIEPTPGPTEDSMFPPPGEGDWVLGDNPDATLTVIEYSDFM